MDNKELDLVLASKFKSMQKVPQGASLAPAIMARIADEAQAGESAGASMPVAKHRPDWVLAFAWLLGALVCVPSLGGFDPQMIMQWLPLELMGEFAPSVAALALPLLLIIALLPTAWLMLED